MQYFKISFSPLKYGERCLTVFTCFNSEKEFKDFYKGDEKLIIEYSISNESDYNYWLINESNKKKYKL
jgi:hypothetical protein